MLKVLRRFRSRSQSEPAQGSSGCQKLDGKLPLSGKKEDSNENNKEMDSSANTRESSEMDGKFNQARLKRLLARCEKENCLALTSDEECCICLSGVASVMALPCRHRVTCKGCSVKMISEAHENKETVLHCPVCRAQIVQFFTDKHLAKMVARPPLENFVPYDLNVPRGLGRRCHSVSTGSSIPIKRSTGPSGPASSA